MKLPDFSLDKELCDLRDRMGASLVVDITLKAKEIPLLSMEEIEALSGVGLDRTLADCSEAPDGTITFKGKRVIVYIRDRHQYRDSWSAPRFHVAFCRTLKEKIEAGKFDEKYVVSQRDDGKFPMNIFAARVQERSIVKSELVELNVCQNCLKLLAWNGFTWRMSESDKAGAVAAFHIADFFIAYPKDLIPITPRYTSDNAPLNDYPSNWSAISRAFKAKRGGKCERCSSKQRLQVHHINGTRYDNRDENLKVLCEPCHSLEHPHMRQN